jgi:hypothetical protein
VLLASLISCSLSFFLGTAGAELAEAETEVAGEVVALAPAVALPGAFAPVAFGFVVLDVEGAVRLISVSLSRSKRPGQKTETHQQWIGK